MRRRFSKREYVLAGFFALIALFPLATRPDGEEMEILPPVAALLPQREFMEMRSEHIQMNRMRKDVLEACSRRSSDGADEECPDINNFDSMIRFMRGIPVLHEAASEAADIPLTILDLSDHQESMLRRFERVRTCPEGLDDILPGFFELCTSVIDHAEDLRPRFKSNGMIPVEFFPILNPTLEQIIKIKTPQ